MYIYGELRKLIEVDIPLRIKFDDHRNEVGYVEIIRPNGDVIIRSAVQMILDFDWRAPVEQQIIGRCLIKVPAACEIEINPPLFEPGDPDVRYFWTCGDGTLDKPKNWALIS